MTHFFGKIFVFIFILQISNVGFSAQQKHFDEFIPSHCNGKPELGQSLQLFAKEKKRLQVWQDVYQKNSGAFSPIVQEAYTTNQISGGVAAVSGMVLGAICPILLASALIDTFLAIVPSALVGSAVMGGAWLTMGAKNKPATPDGKLPIDESEEHAQLRDSLFGKMDGAIRESSVRYITQSRALIKKVMHGLKDEEDSNYFENRVKDGPTIWTRLQNGFTFGHFDYALAQTHQAYDTARYEVYTAAILDVDYVITRLKSECDTQF